MADVDYGYGDAEPDYGYGEAKPAYGETANTDYGYGETQTTDYGYGNAEPDYGYGEAKPDEDTPKEPSTDYGYGDEAAPAPKPSARRMTKRRCSVTKYSLETAAENAGSPEAEMVQQLHAANIVQQLRQGLTAPPPDYPQQSHHAAPAPEPVPEPAPEAAPVADTHAHPHESGERKKGVFSKIRKRLSVAF